jgi:hypothetical protein
MLLVIDIGIIGGLAVLLFATFMIFAFIDWNVRRKMKPPPKPKNPLRSFDEADIY